MQLLCAVIGLDSQMPASAAAYKASVYLLTLRFGVLNSKSAVPAVSSISEPEDANGKHAVLVSHLQVQEKGSLLLREHASERLRKRTIPSRKVPACKLNTNFNCQLRLPLSVRALLTGKYLYSVFRPTL